MTPSSLEQHYKASTIYKIQAFLHPGKQQDSGTTATMTQDTNSSPKV